MYFHHRRPRGRAALARFLSVGLAGITVVAVAQACTTTAPPVDGSGGGGSGGTGGSTGGSAPTTGGSGGTPVTGGSGGTAGENTGGSAGEGGMGGSLSLDFTSESGISEILSLPAEVMGAALLIDRVASCEAFTDAVDAGATWGDSKQLFLTFGDNENTALEPGSYPVTNQPAPDEGKFGSATFVTYDAECTQDTLAAPSGVITITAVDGHAITGSYDLVFPDDRTLEGTFSTEACPAINWDTNAPTTCY